MNARSGFVSLLAAGLLSAGCQSTPSKGATTPAAAPKPAAAEPDERGAPEAEAEPAPEQEPPPAPPEPAITSEGFQPLEGWEGELSIESLQERFPDYEAGATTHSSEGIEYKKYALKKDGEVVVRFSKAERVSDIDEVIVYTPDFPGPEGLAVGATFSDVREAAGPLRCSFGAEDTRWGRCQSESMENLIFLFDLRGVDTGECTIDCVIAEEHLAGEELDGIEWFD